VLVALAVLIAAGIAIMHTAYFQRSVLNYFAARLHHPVEVKGAMELDLLSPSPSLTATDVTLSNPPWMPPGTAAQIGKLSVVFDFPWPGRARSIQRLEMDSARLHLVRNAEGRANWQWRAPGTPRKGLGVLVRSFSMRDAHVVLDDDRRHLQFDGTVSAGDADGAVTPPLRIEGSGQLNGRPASFVIDGEPLALASHHRPYGFTFVERSGDSMLRGQGHLLQPFDPGVLDTEFAASGPSMSELYFLTGLHFANTAPFTLTGKAERRGARSKFGDLVAHFGKSDVRGTVSVQTVDGRPRFDADLASSLLRLYDFGRQRPDGQPERSAAPSSLVLPDVHVPLQGLRNREAVVRFRADTIASRALSVTAFSTHATISDGVLTATDIAGRFRGGRVSGSAKIDVRGDVPVDTLDLALSNLPLDQFARKEKAGPPFEGQLQTRLQISGRGRSVHELAASANGTVSLSISNGAMRVSMAEMSAATLRGLGLTLTKSDRKTAVQHGSATFVARNGVLSAQRLVIETDPVVITGTGNVRLDTETLDLVLHGEPKKRRLLRLHTPVNLTGSLKHPAFHLGGSGQTSVTQSERATRNPISPP
jgi:hypothetical protein